MKVQVDLSYVFFLGFGQGGTVLQSNFTDSARFFSPFFFFLQNCYIMVCGTWKFSCSLKGT